MTECNCAAVGVDVLRVLGKTQVAEHSDALGGEGFIQFDDGEIGRRKAEESTKLLRRRCGTETHDPRCHACSCSAHDASDRIIYNDVNGSLLFDIDGKGGQAAVKFAQISAGLTLSNVDFLIA